MSKRVIITGATGWLGQEFLFRQFLKDGDRFIDNFILVGGTSRTIKLFDRFQVKVYSLEEINNFDEIDGIIHLAFVLRHRVNEFGVQEFLKLNEGISQKVANIVNLLQPNWIVNVSSGAIFDRQTGEYAVVPKLNPYGFSKRQEEIVLTDAAMISNIPLVIGRLWGASGYKMPPNSAYALSDFVESALTKKQITINSDFEVFRRYCDAGEFLEVLVTEARAGNSLVINSGGPLHEIGEIAKMIADTIGDIAITRPAIKNLEADDYYPRESHYESLAAANKIGLATMREQVKRTIEGHVNFSKRFNG